MNKHIIPAFVGAVLLVFAVVLSVASTKSSNAKKIRIQTLVLKYKNLSDAALKSGDAMKATNYAKLAISADPNSKIGYTCLTNAISAKYNNGATAATAQPNTATNSNAPSASDSSSADLGC